MLLWPYDEKEAQGEYLMHCALRKAYHSLSRNFKRYRDKQISYCGFILPSSHSFSFPNNADLNQAIYPHGRCRRLPLRALRSPHSVTPLQVEVQIPPVLRLLEKKIKEKQFFTKRLAGGMIRDCL